MTWHCDITKNPVGTDTVMIGAPPCDCQGCRAADRIEALEAALRCADQFITNGIELGYIRMPDADTPDSAHKTPSIIRATLAPETNK